MFTRSVSPEQAPDKATYLEIDFEKGDPVALDGQKLSPASLLAQLNKVLTTSLRWHWVAVNLFTVIELHLQQQRQRGMPPGEAFM